MSNSPSVDPLATPSNPSGDPSSQTPYEAPTNEEGAIILTADENFQAYTREELEEDYLDLKGEVWLAPRTRT